MEIWLCFFVWLWTEDLQRISFIYDPIIWLEWVDSYFCNIQKGSIECFSWLLVMPNARLCCYLHHILAWWYVYYSKVVSYTWLFSALLLERLQLMLAVLYITFVISYKSDKSKNPDGFYVQLMYRPMKTSGHFSHNPIISELFTSSKILVISLICKRLIFSFGQWQFLSSHAHNISCWHCTIGIIALLSAFLYILPMLSL